MRATRASVLATVIVAASTIRPAHAESRVRACIAASTDAQTLRRQGKLLAARESLITCARDACPAIVRSHCARWLSEVEAAIPAVVVRAEDERGEDAVDARLSVDGQPAALDGKPIRLDPGEHTLVLENDRGARKEEHVLLVEGETSRRVTLHLPAPAAASEGVGLASPSIPSSPASPPPERVPAAHHVPLGAWILGGAGVAVLGAATYFGIAAGDQLHQMNTTCSPHCTEAQTRDGRTDATIFDVTLGVGAAAVAGALVWGLVFPAHDAAAAWAPRLGVVPLHGGALTAVGTTF